MKNIGTIIISGIVLFFTLGFFFLGESVWMSIIYGLISGISAYNLIMWWQNDEKPEATKEPNLFPFSEDLNRMLVKSKLVKPDNINAKRPTRASSLLEWLIKEDKSPPPRP